MADQIKQWIPNSITLGNLVCGCIAIQYAYLQDFNMAALFVLGGAVLDFFDGFIARLLKVQSELGKQLDSLADVVTFGVAPGIILFNYLRFINGMNIAIHDTYYVFPSVPVALAYVTFCIPVFSAVRLAVFNLDTTQSHSFKGLPTPANGLFFAFFPMLVIDTYAEPNGWSGYSMVLEYPALMALCNPYLIAGLILVFCFLMVSRIPLFALKFKSFAFKGNEIRYIFLTLAAVMLIIFQLRAIPLIVLLYLLLSLIILPFNRKQTHEI